ncbi:MAG: molybdopterin cofactor-binding domain-containing protein [Bdellovibrionota bacterium]
MVLEITKNINRRTFIQKTSTAAGSLTLALMLPEGKKKYQAQAQTSSNKTNKLFKPNAWLSIPSIGEPTFVIDKAEMGQNVYTSLATIICEEFEYDPTKLELKFAPVDPDYNHPEYGAQLTGGSTSVQSGWLPLRLAGATAREMLKKAAADTWGVSTNELSAKDGFIFNKDLSKKASYQELSTKAAQQNVPSIEKSELKTPDNFNLIGKARSRFDASMKVNGSAVFGIDSLPQAEASAVVIHCPTFGGKVKQIDLTKAKNMLGFIDAFPISDGVAIVCEKYWQVLKVKDNVNITWDYGKNRTLTDASIQEILEKSLKDKGKNIVDDGDSVQALAATNDIVTADYRMPYLAHATLEPIACSAEIKDGECHVWTPTQAPTLCHYYAVRASDLPSDKTFIHTVFLGGGFGRKSYARDTREVVEIAKKTGKSVKLIWTREEDIQHDAYRPGSLHRFVGSVGKNGKIESWTHKISGPSILANLLPDFVASALPNFLSNSIKDVVGSTGQSLLQWYGEDMTSLDGAKELPYTIANRKLDYHMVEIPIPLGFWRSVGNSFNGFVTECFVDELAEKAQKDPLEFRLSMLEKNSRYLPVLEAVGQFSNWKKPLEANRHRGIALHKSFGTYVAEVVEIYCDGSLDSLKVEKVYAVVDCGIVVDPDTVRAQIESGIIFGLTAALYGKINFVDGAVKQSNFHDYRLLRMQEIPEVAVEIIHSQEDPTGVGEPGLPPLAPALANAIFSATGKRIRSLPIFT